MSGDRKVVAVGKRPAGGRITTKASSIVVKNSTTKKK